MISSVIKYWKGTTNQTEIGSDFALEWHSDEQNNSYYKNFTVLYTARSCIKLMIQHTSGPYLLPNYLCSSISEQFSDVECDYYSIGDKLQINVSDILAKIRTGSYRTVYFIDYFGVVDKNIEQILSACREFDIVTVEDFTHRPFDIDALYGDIQLCSIRKSVPVPYGGIISGVPATKSSRITVMYFLYCLKWLGIGLKRWGWLKFVWRPLLVYCESMLDRVTTTTDSSNDIRRWLQLFNYSQIKQTRLDNFNVLHAQLSGMSLVNKPVYAYFPMVFNSTEERDRVRKKLIDGKVYPAIHWPQDHPLYKRILSIPIDQRYNSCDMDRIVKLVKSVVV